jgi:tellurite methyltransferase
VVDIQVVQLYLKLSTINMPANYFNELYSKSKQYFGDHPENMLRDYFSMCDKKGRVLDIGIGQGRNARFLMQQGYGVDGIDISSVAIESLDKMIKEEHLDLKLFHMEFDKFNCAPRTYSAVLIFNLFPVLSEAKIEELAHKARRWVKRNGIIFVTGYTTNEVTFKPALPEWHKVSTASYTDDKGNYRTFMDVDDAISKFKRFKPVYSWEGYGERHSHGNDQIEQHHVFELILQKV